MVLISRDNTFTFWQNSPSVCPDFEFNVCPGEMAGEGSGDIFFPINYSVCVRAYSTLLFRYDLRSLSVKLTEFALP